MDGPPSEVWAGPWNIHALRLQNVPAASSPFLWGPLSLSTRIHAQLAHVTQISLMFLKELYSSGSTMIWLLCRMAVFSAHSTPFRWPCSRHASQAASPGGLAHRPPAPLAAPPPRPPFSLPVQISLPPTMRMTTAEGTEYIAVQMHFHWGGAALEISGSEHTIDGLRYAAEVP